MGMLTLLLMAVSLSMDACAAALSAGLTLRNIRWGAALKTGLFFGVFQMLMPILGYLAGAGVHKWIAPIDHWVVFGLLTLIGINMIREGLGHKEGEEKKEKDLFSTKVLFLLAIATSIDALAVGISLAMVNENIVRAASIIGVVTFALSTLCVLLGSKLGSHKGVLIEKYASIAGGLVLIGIGVKTLLEHMLV